MKDEIEKAINNFSQGNKDLSKILALFGSQIGIIFTKHLTKKITDELFELDKFLLEYYDKK